MLGKLIKYDFKWINKIMYVYFIIMFIVTIAVKIVESIDQTLFLVIVDKILSGAFISIAISMSITCIMRIWSRFITNIYKDESYLTHTLPITKSEIFNSKIIAGILSILMTVIVIIACVAIVALPLIADPLKIMYDSLVQTYNGTYAVLFIIGIVLLIALEIIFFMISGIFGIVIGHSFNNYKMLISIIVGIISYGLLSTVSLVIIGILSEVADFEIVNNAFPSLKTLKIMGFTSIGIYLVFNLTYYFIAKKILNRGVNVD